MYEVGHALLMPKGDTTPHTFKLFFFSIVDCDMDFAFIASKNSDFIGMLFVHSYSDTR